MSQLIKFPLFDIDGTLVTGGNHIHHEAFDYALHTVYELPQASHRDVDRSGKIDPQILIEIAQIHGMTEEAAKEIVPSAMKAMVHYFERHKDSDGHILLEGVKELLQTLYEKHIPIGLLTGNVEEIGWGKMELAGIRKYFSFGAFGNEAFERADLIPVAHKKLEVFLKEKISLKRLVIIGDTPLDIACAKVGDIDVIAVETGKFSKQELAHLEPNLVIDSLHEKEKILNFLNIT
jgi:phosphoglycolate phosphatase-like HAD superfamily hydrolase